MKFFLLYLDWESCFALCHEAGVEVGKKEILKTKTIM